MPALRIEPVDPQGKDALSLLRSAAIEARQLYPDLHAADAPWPTNPALPARGAYVIAYADDTPVGCGALRPLDAHTAEVRRMYVLASARRTGVAREVLLHLEQRARELGYGRLRLETGNRQLPAIALYESMGFVRIPPFGDYVDDPVSVCFEKSLKLRG